MADLYGAPGGISARITDDARLMATEADALKTLSELNMAPTRKALAEAQTRNYNAEASKTEAAIVDARKLEQLFADVNRPQAAATDPDMPGWTAPAAPQKTPTERLEELVSKGYERGMYSQMQPFHKALTTALRGEAAQAASQASATLRANRARIAELEYGSRAAQGVQDQASYDRMILGMLNDGKDVSDMPRDYAAARPMLDQLRSQGLTMAQALRAKEDKTRTRIMQEQQATRERLANVRIAQARSRTAMTDLQRANLLKNGGPNNPTTQAAKDATRRRQEALTEATNLRNYPHPPEDKTKLVPGKVYTSAVNGNRYMWTKDGWLPVQKPVQDTPVNLGMDADTDVDLDDDEDEDDSDLFTFQD